MKKKHIIRKNYEFTRIFNEVKPYQTTNFVFYLEAKTNDNFAFGIAVSKKNANAVTRNFIKRRIRKILDQYSFQKSFNCIILCKKGVEKENFHTLKNEITTFLQKFDLLE